MADHNWRLKFMNPFPPDDVEVNFNTAVVTSSTVPVTEISDFIINMLIKYEIDFKNLPDTEESSNSSSEETLPQTSSANSKWSAVGPIKSSSKKSSPVVKKEPIISIIPDPKIVKLEILSDGEISAEEDKKKGKTKSPSKKKNTLGLDYSDSEGDYSDSERKPRIKPKRERKYYSDDEYEVEYKHIPGVTAAFGEYYCKACDIVMNSEVTMNTHMSGKRHQKALKAKEVSKVALQSLTLMSGAGPGKALRYPVPAPRKKHVPVNGISLIQAIADEYDKGPLPGLSSVIEIHSQTKDINYYCTLCDSPCSSASIMPHLVGFRHQLRCLEEIDHQAYEKYRFLSKREVERRLIQILFDYESLHGRGLIRVETEVEDKYPTPRSRDEPRQRNEGMSNPSTSKETDSDVIEISCTEDLDTSMNDFYCKVCDAHMNNKSMWESHVIGKRHLKNKKKYPGENVSKVKAIFCPHSTAHLMDRLRDIHEPVVGLDFIKETQGEGGDMYNCYLCGACTTNFDIVDHLLTTKHRIKYLEAINKKGKANAIEDIKVLYNMSSYAKDQLVAEECQKIIDKYGLGKIDVYKSKDVLPPSRRRY